MCRHHIDKMGFFGYYQRMIEDWLQKLDFTPNESKVFLLLQVNQALSGAEVTKKTGLKRSTAYAVLSSLEEKGVITRKPNEKVDKYIPLPAEHLLHVLAHEELLLNKKKEVAKRVVAELQQFGAAASFSIPKVVFVGEESMEEFLYANTDKWNESILQNDKTVWGIGNSEYIQEFNEYLVWWSAKSIRVGIEVKLFTANNNFDRELIQRFPNREHKQWVGQPFERNMTVSGEYILIENPQKPYYLVEIQDKILASNLREMFKVMWSVL